MTARVLVIAAVVGCSSGAKTSASSGSGSGSAVPPAPLATPSDAAPADAAPYAAELARGRELEARRDFAGAVAAFEHALAARSDDAAASSELGWCALQLGDLDRADRATRTAIDHATTSRLKAASLYNLGQLEDKRGHKAEAVKAYAQSLSLRPNRVVAAALAKLDPRAAAEADPLALQALDGPHRSLDAYCRGVRDADPDAKCAPTEPRDLGTVHLAAPFREVAVFVAGHEVPNNPCVLAIRVASGWFVRDLDACESHPKYGAGLTVNAVTVAARGLVVRYTAESSSRDDQAESEREALVVCHVDGDGAVGCTPDIPVRARWHSELDPAEDGSYELNATVSGADITLRAKTDHGKADPQVRELVGMHHLAY